MENNRLDLKYLRKVILIFILLVLAGTWLMEFFFDDKYTKSIYFYFEFWLYIIAPIVFGLLFYVINYIDRKSSADSKSEKLELMKDFKAHAKTIEVNFEDCDVSHKEYEKEVILRKDTRYEERKIVRFSECQIEYSFLENKFPITYRTRTLYMELIDLRYKLFEKKKTTIYVDNKGENRFVDKNGMSYFADDEGNPFYYFDVEFLGESVLKRPKAESSHI